MAADDLIVFDTCTLPEYYADVHKVLALPRGYVVTYDYSAKHIDDRALDILRTLVKTKESRRAFLAYIQQKDYKKGDSSSDFDPLPEDCFSTLTRLAEVVAVREVTNNDKTRYYIDLCLQGYPFDRKQTLAKDIVAELRARNSIPMKTYIALCPDAASNALFNQTGADDQGFSTVVEGLASAPSQFSLDTFWRIYKVASRTKSAIPFVTSASKHVVPVRRIDEWGKSETYLSVPDQTTIYFHIQFHRGREHGPDYRIRKIDVDVSPKSASQTAVASFPTRSFGQEVVAANILATSSLAMQEVRYQFETMNHESDNRKDYPYGPTVNIPVQYRKSIRRSLLALAMICAASGLFAWAAFSTSFATAQPSAGVIVPLSDRALAVIVGVLVSMYAYYLWSDEIVLDRVRRS